MNRMFVTGDTHGDLTRVVNFIQENKLGAGDAIIILGDAGICWRRDRRDLDFTIDRYEQYCNGTTLYFIDGNHENFDIVNNLPIVENTGFISEHIRHLIRGEQYIINDIKILACGGADSIDWYLRQENISWWKDETISKDLVDSIPACNIDYLLTHCCPRSVFENNRPYLITLRDIDQSKVNHNSEDRLEDLIKKVSFKHNYFGHYHIDKQVEDKHTCVFKDFIELRKDR